MAIKEITIYWSAGRHLYNCRYIFYSGRQVGTLKFADILLQVGRSALLTMLKIHQQIKTKQKCRLPTQIGRHRKKKCQLPTLK